eukprot:9556763-Lingulodinium_polyedra.AAC.1
MRPPRALDTEGNLIPCMITTGIWNATKGRPPENVMRSMNPAMGGGTNGTRHGQLTNQRGLVQ